MANMHDCVGWLISNCLLLCKIDKNDNYTVILNSPALICCFSRQHFKVVEHKYLLFQRQSFKKTQFLQLRTTVVFESHSLNELRQKIRIKNNFIAKSASILQVWNVLYQLPMFQTISARPPNVDVVLFFMPHAKLMKLYYSYYLMHH